MKRLLVALAVLLGVAGTAQAQYLYTSYYSPAPAAVVTTPSYVTYDYGYTTYSAAPYYSYYGSTYPFYSWAPASTYTAYPYTYSYSYYGPTVVTGLPAWYGPYGGAEVRVPGQPVRNALRTVIP